MTRRRLGCLIVAVAGVAGAAGFWLGSVAGWATAEHVTTSRLSPDETMRARLLELAPLDPMRPIAVRLDRIASRDAVTLLSWQTDVGPVAGTERFVWSRDGGKVLLVGRHFFVRDDLMLAGGDQLYLLHDLKSGQTWLNSANDDSFPRLTADLIAGVEFTEPVILQPRARVDPGSPEKRE